MTANELLEQVVHIADGKKARDIVAMKVENKTSFTDYIVLMTGTSTTHIKALSDEIEFQLKQQDVQPHHIEGVTSSWILLDYTSVVVNVFLARPGRCTPWSACGATPRTWTFPLI